MTVQYAGSTKVDIAAGIEAAVRAGELAPGDPLPSVRRLATTLRVSAATVAAAYRDLKQRAIIETADRSGTRVRSRPATGSRLSRRLVAPAGARDLAHGGPDVRLLPGLGSQLARLAALPDWDTPAGYDVAGPLPELLDLARPRLAGDGVPVDSAALAVTSGALDGIERILTAHVGPGDRVAVEDPGWANLIDLLAALRLEPVPVAVDEEGPTTASVGAALAAGVRAIVITSRAQNPTGTAVSAERAHRIRGLFAAHPDVLVIEDDHAAELSDLPLAPLVGTTRAWAFVRSVSKPYGPDLRVAVLAGDEATVDRMAGRQLFGAGWVSTVLQRLVVELWNDPDVDRLIGRARESYARRRDGLRAALAARGVASLGRSGLNVWIPAPDETRIVARLRDSGWVVAPGSMFRMRSAPAVRITVSSLDVDDLEPLASAVADAMAETNHGYAV